MSAAAADRFFRAYTKHCVAPDADTLFNLLNAVHSLNDRMRKAGDGNLFGSRSFAALRALRNLFHHEHELLHEVRILAAKNFPISAELMFVCLINRKMVDLALGREEKGRQVITEALNWYGESVDIQPCIFNCAVDVFEMVEKAEYGLESEEYRLFQNSYQYEEENGLDHHVRGRISCLAGDVSRVLSEMSRSGPSKA